MKTHPDPHPSNEASASGCTAGCATASVVAPDALPRCRYSNAAWSGPVVQDSVHGLPNRRKRHPQGIDQYLGIQSLRFELSARTLAIDATAEALEMALAAIRQAGFTPQPLSAKPEDAPSMGFSEFGKALLALTLAVGAEAVDYLAPDTLPISILGMVLAAAAIGLSGLSTYRKGLSALGRGQLNMNALMGVAVTGAFLIGQWPEAAMVMALYAIAELIEARSVDQARNAIQGLLALTPDTAEVRRADGSWIEMPAERVLLGLWSELSPVLAFRWTGGL